MRLTPRIKIRGWNIKIRAVAPLHPLWIGPRWWSVRTTNIHILVLGQRLAPLQVANKCEKDRCRACTSENKSMGKIWISHQNITIALFFIVMLCWFIDVSILSNVSGVKRMAVIVCWVCAHPLFKAELYTNIWTMYCMYELFGPINNLYFWLSSPSQTAQPR